MRARLKLGPQLLLCASMLARPAIAQTDSLRQLDDILSEAGAATDPPTVQYVAVRCSALYISLSKLLEHETEPDKIHLKEKFETMSQNLLVKAYHIEVSLTNNQKERDAYREELPHDLLTLATIYTDHLHDARLRLGNAARDPLVLADAGVCQPLAH